MGRIGVDVDAKRGRGASQSARADSGTVDSFQQFLFHRTNPGDFRTLIQRTGQSLFCQERAFFKGSPNANADHHGRAGVRASLFHSGEHGVLHTFFSICRLQHKNPAHVLTAEPLGRHRYFYPVSGNDGIMNDARRVVLRVFTDKGIGNHRFTQTALGISPAYAFVDRILKNAALKMDFLSHFQKNHRHSRILTDRNGILSGDLKILAQLIQHAAPERRFLALLRLFQRFFHILCEKKIGFYAHLLHCIRNL